MQVAVARQLYVASDEADGQAALARQAAHNRRTLAVSRAPDSKAGSHVLAYANAPGETERNALVGTPDEICGGLEAVNKAGAEYVLLTILGGKEQFRTFAREIMPAFSVCGQRVPPGRATADVLPPAASSNRRSACRWQPPPDAPLSPPGPVVGICRRAKTPWRQAKMKLPRLGLAIVALGEFQGTNRVAIGGRPGRQTASISSQLMLVRQAHEQKPILQDHRRRVGGGARNGCRRGQGRAMRQQRRRLRGVEAGVRRRGQGEGRRRLRHRGADGNELCDRDDQRRPRQKSFKLSLDEFLVKRGANAIVSRGRALKRTHAALFASIEQRYGVPPGPLLAIWGMETAFGSQRGNQNMLSAVATLAYDCRRSEYFTDQLYAALTLIERGTLSAGTRGSMHGEYGQTQFMPKSILQCGTGNLDSAAGALTSTANFLKGHGWRAGAGYQQGQPNFAAIQGWNAATVYQQAIALMGRQIDGGGTAER